MGINKSVLCNRIPSSIHSLYILGRAQEGVHVGPASRTGPKHHIDPLLQIAEDGLFRENLRMEHLVHEDAEGMLQLILKVFVGCEKCNHVLFEHLDISNTSGNSQ
jgi:hypothetical protein